MAVTDVDGSNLTVQISGFGLRAVGHMVFSLLSLNEHGELLQWPWSSR